jgi:CRISPR-associated protein Csx17
MGDLMLEGCSPVPLASYLKALGVLRLIAEGPDPEARGWWERDRFWLRTRLSRDELSHFFLHDYRPTPIIAPWNGGSGFYPKDAKYGISAIQESSLERFSPYRAAINLGYRIIQERNLGERPSDEAKNELIAAVRAESAPAVIGWIDTAVALSLDKPAYPPLLGTGGNDGRLDFTNNFMQRLVELIPTNGGPLSPGTVASLDDALFGVPTAGLSSAAIGQFAPGAAGGPNSVAGFQGDPLVNGWDFVLMLEGAPVFSGGVSRRLEGADAAYLSYPFTVRSAAAGYGSASLSDQEDARGELWAPLWKRPVGYGEVRTLFREGRLSLGARPARDGLDAARAVNALGVDRGITGFERYGFVKRQGLAYLATPLGRRRVLPNPHVDLLADLDRGQWLDRLRGKAASDEATADLREAARKVGDSIFSFVEQPKNRQTVQGMLAAIGAATYAIALRPKLQGSLRPPPLLSSQWIVDADDESVEFRVALALAGMRARPKGRQEDKTAAASGTERVANRDLKDLLMRAHLAPLDPDSVGRAEAWALKQQRAAEGRVRFVWGAGPLVDNLCSVARQRLLESRRESSDIPFESGFDTEQRVPVAVDSGEIATFLDGDVRDERIAALLLGLAWVQPSRSSSDRGPEPLPFAYAAIKPLFTPRSVFRWLKAQGELEDDVPDLPLPAALTSFLTAGRVQDAVRLAQQLVRASGLPAPFLTKPVTRAADPKFGRRLLAALIIPVRPAVVRACLNIAYPTSE